ncbi:hypothetical protein SAMN04487910_2058 [Aquimarina amphilecti]|uniref:Uncharacterized protein n=1 Tax=Aquimarina amphilecti TaxID=1038014 RepID=A0A1H7NES2_AQUAM|nr:hypothetical protein [Aquimarina amphilecti]SEL22000.1 hypothetical protein SAMN04487910_2058 [Aquimarina amphilecti]
MKINYNDLVLNKNIQYSHNPFGGIDDEELLDIIDPKHSFEKLIQTLNQDSPIIIQFVGRKGRGKTTHLRALHQLIPEAEMHFLNRSTYKWIVDNTNKYTFIDSVHHISWRKRLQLWRNYSLSYVITTHIPRDLEFLFCKRKYKTFYFNGITPEKLEIIIKKRISQFSYIKYQDILLNQTILNQLIQKFGDNIRAILNFLYDRFKIESYGY